MKYFNSDHQSQVLGERKYCGNTQQSKINNWDVRIAIELGEIVFYPTLSPTSANAVNEIMSYEGKLLE